MFEREKHFIISINLFGNGLSSSPTNADEKQKGSKFPSISLFDNIACQHKLINQHLNIRKIAFFAKAKIKIDRTKWGIKYNSGNFFKDLGDKVILDEIEFEINLLSAS